MELKHCAVWRNLKPLHKQIIRRKDICQDLTIQDKMIITNSCTNYDQLFQLVIATKAAIVFVSAVWQNMMMLIDVIKIILICLEIKLLTKRRQTRRNKKCRKTFLILFKSSMNT